MIPTFETVMICPDTTRFHVGFVRYGNDRVVGTWLEMDKNSYETIVVTMATFDEERKNNVEPILAILPLAVMPLFMHLYARRSEDVRVTVERINKKRIAKWRYVEYQYRNFWS